MATLFWFTIRQSVRLRKLWLSLLLLAGPSVLVLLIRYFEEPDRIEHVIRLYRFPMMFRLFPVVLPLVCMLYGSGLIGSEVEGRTIVYLVTRRIRRETVLLVRFVAVALFLTALLSLAVTALHLCAILGLDLARLNELSDRATDRVWDPWHDLAYYLRAVPFAVAAFLAVFTLVSLTLPRPLIISVVYLVLVELIVSNMPVRAQIYTINHQLRRMMTAAIPGLMNGLRHRPDRSLLEVLYPPGETGTLPLIVVILAALGLCCLVVKRFELMPAKVGRD